MTKNQHVQGKRIAVVGTGISGLSAAWLLSRNHHVTVFERDTRLGGHSNTVDIDTSAGPLPVDTGFIVFNERCYPNLTRLFEQLGVSCRNTDMSFGVSIDNGRLEYAGSDSLASLFAQKRNLLRPGFWRMLADLVRFYRNSGHWLHSLDDSLSLGELLEREGFGARFRDDHLIPMGAAIWSTPADDMLRYPARAFLRFCQNHGLLQLKDRPQWQTVAGGSREYVQRLAAPFLDAVQLGCGARTITRKPNSVELTDTQGRQWQFDDVVLACHADQALPLLSDPTPQERELLSTFAYSRNTAYLHRDPRLMPGRRRAWASWNYLSGAPTGRSGALSRQSETGDSGKISVTYWMNQLQHLPVPEPILVTLNPLRPPREALVYRQFEYDHPLFDGAALSAQKRLWSLQGQLRTWFCGSHFGHGFHEDGLQAGLAVAEALGGESRPWQVPGQNDRLYLPAELERAA